MPSNVLKVNEFKSAEFYVVDGARRTASDPDLKSFIFKTLEGMARCILFAFGLATPRARAAQLPNALPAVPRRVQTCPEIEVDAVGRRVDLQIARIELDLLAGPPCEGRRRSCVTL